MAGVYAASTSIMMLQALLKTTLCDGVASANDCSYDGGSLGGGGKERDSLARASAREHAPKLARQHARAAISPPATNGNSTQTANPGSHKLARAETSALASCNAAQ